MRSASLTLESLVLVGIHRRSGGRERQESFHTITPTIREGRQQGDQARDRLDNFLVQIQITSQQDQAEERALVASGMILTLMQTSSLTVDQDLPNTLPLPHMKDTQTRILMIPIPIPITISSNKITIPIILSTSNHNLHTVSLRDLHTETDQSQHG